MLSIFQKVFVILLTVSVSAFCKPVYAFVSESDETETTEIKEGEGEGEKESELKSKGRYGKAAFDSNDLGFLDSSGYRVSLSLYFINQGKAPIHCHYLTTPFYLLYHNLKLDC